MKSSRSGSVIVLILGLFVIFSVIGYAVSNLTLFSLQHFFRSYDKKKLFLESEGIINGFTKLTQSYIENTANISVPLHDYINSKIGALTPPGYTIVNWDVVVSASSSVSNLPNGPFKGMQAAMNPVHYVVELKDNAKGEQMRVALDGLLAGITFTQFASFSFRDLYLIGQIPLTLNGRIHGNNLVCLGAKPVKVRAITSAGSIQHSSACYPGLPGPINVLASIDGTMANTANITSTANSGCTNCDGTGQNWPMYSLNRWNGNVQDSSHGVPKLSLKFSGTPAVQSRKTDWAGVPHIDPANPERFLVDPPLATDSGSIRDLKFANRADIRIINGVWYVRDPANAASWPGIPVWSDHPGTFAAFAEEGIVPANGSTTASVNGVGQKDIRNWLAINAVQHQWNVNTIPKKFSYYEYDEAAESILDTNGGTVSYGNITKKTATTWMPGHYVMNDPLSGKNNMCNHGSHACTNCATPNILQTSDVQITCSGGPVTPIAANVLNATRSGLRFNLWEYYSRPIAERQDQSKILPLNFDVAAFQNAMKCDYDPLNPGAATDHPGEIGCYFKSWGLIGKPFNGIIYISNTWKGVMNNVMAPAPYAQAGVDIHHAGTNSDANQIGIAHPAQQESLPFELCSDDATVIGHKFDGAGLFKVPDCARYNESLPPGNAIRTRASVVRIINSQNMDTALLPAGLTIASNLQVYMVGDVNTSSDTNPGGTPWSPLLIAGDQVVPFSNNWADHNAPWNVMASSGTLTKIAADTTYNVSLLSGQGALFMFNENWMGKTLKFRGPALQPYDFLGIYMNNGFANALGTFQYPTQDYAYDPHYELFTNQPPGVPTLTVFAVSSWLAQ